MNEKLIILGTASSLARTPWDKEDCDYWACCPVITHKPVDGHRIDVIFEMHPESYWNNVEDVLNKYIKDNPDTIVYMQNKTGIIKNSIEYPLKQIQESVNNEFLKKYLTSTIAQMIALAIFKGQYKRIELWGCHMAADEEQYSNQRACCEAWLNYGLGKGIDYWVTEESDLMRASYIYGYEQQKGLWLKLCNIRDRVRTGLTELEEKEKKLRDEMLEQSGGYKVLQKLVRMFRE